MNANTVLLVDDDDDIIEFLEYNFKKAGYIVFSASDGNSAYEIALKQNPDIIIIDIMMKGMDGIQLCEKLSSAKDKISSMKMFLSARGEDYSQIAGFESGADDFVVKPVNPKVLIKRVEALLKRRSSGDLDNANSKLEARGGFMIDKEKYLIYLNGKSFVLPRKEFNLLELLASIPGKVFQREEIYDKVWGDAYVGDRTIDVHIRKLREKLGDDVIVTIKGVGYKFNPPA
jgi:two-component system, OmpR family, alkaline phosphatase synthesis response regulator PhoP